MPRISRIVAVDYPHHITQRGVRSMDIFHSNHDRNQYLQFMKEEALENKRDVCYSVKNPDLRKNKKAELSVMSPELASMLTEIGGQAGCLASQMNLNFKYPVYFGDTVTCVLKITDIKDGSIAKMEATFRNQDGNVVIEAESVGILPDELAKQAMRLMIDEGDPTNKI